MVSHGRRWCAKIEMMRLLLRIAFLAALLAVTVVSLTPQPDLPEIELWDKWQHVAAYAILALLAAPVFEGRDARWTIAMGLSLWGGLLELGQLFVPGRSSDWLDAAANAAGVVLGATLAWVVKRAWKRASTAQGSGQPR